MWPIIEIAIGLFIWLALPNLVFQKKNRKKAPYKRFATAVCAVLGFAIIALGAINLIKSLIHVVLS